MGLLKMLGLWDKEKSVPNVAKNRCCGIESRSIPDIPTALNIGDAHTASVCTAASQRTGEENCHLCFRPWAKAVGLSPMQRIGQFFCLVDPGIAICSSG